MRHGTDLPPRQEQERAIWETLNEAEEAMTKEAIAAKVAEKLNIPEQALKKRSPNGRSSRLVWECAWGLSKLKKQGVVRQPGRGLFEAANGQGTVGEVPERGVQSADAAYRFFLDPTRGGACFADGRFEKMVSLMEQGVRSTTAAEEAGLEKRAANYVTYLVHTNLPEIVRAARTMEGKPEYEVSMGLRAAFENEAGRVELVRRLVEGRYGTTAERLRHEAAQAQRIRSNGNGASRSEIVAELRKIGEQCNRIEEKVNLLLEAWEA